MRLCYVLLSPTFGMHQYTADLANRMAQAGYETHLVTTARYPRDRYLPAVAVHTPINTRNTGFSPDGLRLRAFPRLQATLAELKPDLVHITGPHLWNVPLLWWLRRRGIPAVHSLHDLDPHSGAIYGRLLYGWNWLVIRLAGHLLVHGLRYLNRLLAQGIPPRRVTHVPLLHLFLGQTWLEGVEHLTGEVSYEPWALFFGRMEHYKGVDHLITACAMLNNHYQDAGPKLVLAGPGLLAARWAGALPPRIEVRDRLIGDEEALDLFCRCGLVVLPYLDATQSALIPAAYFFRKPVIVTYTGALPEYVEPGRTGWLVEADHPPSLARCLDAALANPAHLAEMGAAGRAWYDRQRTAEQQVLERMYERLVEDAVMNKLSKEQLYQIRIGRL
ncbi:MAG: glycosyltransferase family 4 protein [Anaerolineae bacterium]|nr:glycosyltransferase family 4 protein [Anaerolineae bacterium]